MSKIDIKEGSKVKCKGIIYTIYRVLNLKWVMGHQDGTTIVEKLKIEDLELLEQSVDKKTKEAPIILAKEKDWETARERLTIITPILENREDRKIVEKVSKDSGISKATLYRWVNSYEESNMLHSLIPKENNGGKNKSRLPKEVDLLIKEVIEKNYLTDQRLTAEKICIEVFQQCKKAGLSVPHSNSIRYRINQLSEYQRLLGRFGKKTAKEKFSPKIHSFPKQDRPLSSVQIDHTKLDIIVVDENYRKPIGRPFITLAIDNYSRMILGFYISLDPPGSIGTGLCICHSVLPKEQWLAKMEVKGEWPCWGFMKVLHLDNAKEFKGDMLKMACEEYGIQIDYRPPGTPHFGGTVERVIGTFVKELHSLPGTTFSNVHHRNNYESEKKAAFTLAELEKWLTVFIVNVYHQRIHKSLMTSPLEKYKQGILGSDEEPGIGVPPRFTDERKLRYDFMPHFERTVQDYGVVIDGIHYYHDILRRWINSVEPGRGKSRLKRKFIFKRDPRDISTLYFLDPELKDYFDIPYRDISRPPMSIWEFNEIMSRLKAQGRENINEEMIFEAYEIMKKLETEAIEKTKSSKKISSKLLKRVESRQKTASLKASKKEDKVQVNFLPNNEKTFEAFDDLEF